MRFRKKPVEVDAIRWNGDNLDDIRRFTGIQYGDVKELIIPTLEGDHTARVGDWIIKGVKGELYPCKPDIFEMTYEPV
jgi:hypothetical protein